MTQFKNDSSQWLFRRPSYRLAQRMQLGGIASNILNGLGIGVAFDIGLPMTFDPTHMSVMTCVKVGAVSAVVAAALFHRAEKSNCAGFHIR